MPVEHKFLNHNNWKNGFWTENAILKTDKYEPEVLIIGTNNPNTPNANFADFFYGRNYFWPAFKNLANGNYDLKSRRMPSNGSPKFPLNPTLDEIFELCKQFKFSFADLNTCVLINQHNIDFLPNDNVILNNIEYNLINDSKKNGVLGLEELDLIGEVEWNTNEIISYLKENQKIKEVYLTRQPTGIWKKHWDEIKIENPDKIFKVIYTPSGNSLPGSPRLNSLICHWLFNNNDNYDRLCHNWLEESEVDINNYLKR